MGVYRLAGIAQPAEETVHHDGAKVCQISIRLRGECLQPFALCDLA